jgi:GATA-binding protein
MASLTDGSRPQPVCQNCQTSTTPLWRRDELGSVLCNACGLFLKLHGRPRPISLKTDVIKSRNRVKNSGQALKKAAKVCRKSFPVRVEYQLDQQALLNGNSRSAHGTPEPVNRRVSNQNDSDRSNSPVSRTMTPSIQAPQAMMDPAYHPQHHLSHSPSLPALHFRQPSPGVYSTNGDRHLEPPHTYEGLQQENAHLRTRVSELEVINGLFKGRIQELERAESGNRQALDLSRARELELTKRLGDLERQVTELRRQTPPTSTPASGTKRRAEDDAQLAAITDISPPYAKRSRLSDAFDAPATRPVSA